MQNSEVFTIQFGEFERLMPGDQITVNVWVAPRKRAITDEDVYPYLRKLFRTPISLEARSVSGDDRHEQDIQVHVEEDPLLRDIPEWFEDSKFGIFMHWGVFAIPGWARECQGRVRYCSTFMYWSLHSSRPVRRMVLVRVALKPHKQRLALTAEKVVAAYPD
jgi:hypothetical protein